jgi:hypothetical protein
MRRPTPSGLNRILKDAAKNFYLVNKGDVAQKRFVSLGYDRFGFSGHAKL